MYNTIEMYSFSVIFTECDTLESAIFSFVTYLFLLSFLTKEQSLIDEKPQVGSRKVLFNMSEKKSLEESIKAELKKKRLERNRKKREKK